MTPDYTAAILETYGRASEEQVRAGSGWYPAAGYIVRTIADWTSVAPERVAHALAALSPRNPWRWNVADAYAYATAAVRDPHGEPPVATTFGANRLRAWDAIRGAGDWRTSAPKVRAFVAAVLGDRSAVVVDVWAVRVATRGERSEVRSDADYRTIADAYTAAAATVGIEPTAMQAITWLVAQDLGLGSARRGRHDVAYKRGTPTAVIALLEREAVRS